MVIELQHGALMAFFDVGKRLGNMFLMAFILGMGGIFLKIVYFKD